MSTDYLFSPEIEFPTSDVMISLLSKSPLVKCLKHAIRLSHNQSKHNWDYAENI